MHTFPDQEVWASGVERITLPVACPTPVQRGSVKACLSASAQGHAIHPSLERTLQVTEGRVADLSLFGVDLARVPRTGLCWLVVRYAGTVIASGRVRVIQGG